MGFLLTTWKQNGLRTKLTRGCRVHILLGMPSVLVGFSDNPMKFITEVTLCAEDLLSRLKKKSPSGTYKVPT